MKRIRLLSLLIVFFVFTSCDFNQSVNKDLTTGAYSRGDGIGCDYIKIQINGEIENRNNFIYGEKVNFIFNNITGLNKKNGKVFPGLSSFIVKNETDTVMQNQDLFKDMVDGTDLSPLLLQTHFVAVLPFENDEKYKVYIKIWDKKGDGVFQYELPFSVKKNNFLKINAQNISYSNIYLWNETKRMLVLNKEINIESTLILILEGLDGLEIVENKVYPSLSIEIIDNNGDPILSNPNILKQYHNEGIDYNTFKNGQIPVTITFSSGTINNPCKIKASLIDLKSDRRIDIDGELIVK